MASKIGFRRFALNAARPVRSFHSSTRSFIKVGDKLPNLDNVLFENSPGNQVDLSEFTKGKALIIGVPAAFSPSCSNSHVPGYINHKALKNAGNVFVVAVNDPFVTKAWGTSLDPSGSSGIRFLADPHGKFTKFLDLDFDGSAIFGNSRSKRYAMEVENGTVKSLHVEPDNTGLDVSAAEKVLG